MSAEETLPHMDESGIKSALRYLGRQTHGILTEIIEHGLDEPTGPVGIALAPLTDPLRVLAEWTAKERALALWALIEEGVKDGSLGPALRSRKRHAVAAALRLPVGGIATDLWGTSLGSRFKQLRAFPSVFGDPTTTQPMEVAWSSGVHVLAAYLSRRFDVLTSIEDWEPYRPHDKPVPDLDEWIAEYDDRAAREHTVLRRPSDQAQKVFVELLVVTAHMRGRAVHRRLTERLITSRDPNGEIQYYTAMGYRVIDDVGRTNVPVRSVWGCREEIVQPERLGYAPVTRLWLPEALKYGEQAHFASEAIFDLGDEPLDEKYWIDVEIDHHGIARGRSLYGQSLPIRGLTIRIRFDDEFLPEAVWWYAELTESERDAQPPPGDRRLLPLVGNAVQYTFTEHVCQPREHYGIAFNWPVGATTSLH